jgi:outer membrane biosynthesis protein TonB
VPTTSRVRVLVAAAAVVLLPLLALVPSGTATATPAACGTLLDPCPTEEPTESVAPTEEPTESPTPSPTPTPSATPSPTPRRTSSPAPRSTRTTSSGSTENPVTGSLDIGGVVGAGDPATTAPETTDSSSTSGSGDHLARLLVLVLGGAVLLGVSGATGLYLTRHHHG